MQCVHERVLCPILAGCALFLDPALENSKRLRRVTAGNVVVYSKGHCTEMRFTESDTALCSSSTERGQGPSTTGPHLEQGPDVESLEGLPM